MDTDYHGIITQEPGKRGGRPCIRGMRIAVADILGWLAAGMTPAGEVLDAGRWTDRNGRNLLVVTRHVDARDASGAMAAATIGVLHVAHLESRPVVLRRMTDPSGPACEFDFVSAVGRDYQVAGDLDGDGYLEVSVAWDSSCLSEASRSTVKVALLSNGRKYILRGLGWPYGRPAGDQWPDTQVVETQPAASSWPAGFHAQAENVFRRLYG